MMGSEVDDYNSSERLSDKKTKQKLKSVIKDYEKRKKQLEMDRKFDNLEKKLDKIKKAYKSHKVQPSNPDSQSQQHLLYGQQFPQTLPQINASYLKLPTQSSEMG